MLLSGINNIRTYSKWFCATELYAIKRNMLITGMRLSGFDCICIKVKKIISMNRSKGLSDSIVSSKFFRVIHKTRDK